MKKKYFLFTTIWVVVFCNASAQHTNNKFYAAGNFNFSKIKSTTEYSVGDGVGFKNSIQVSPGFGLMLNDRIIVGAGMGYDHSRVSEISSIINPIIPPSSLRTSEMLTKELSPFIFAKFMYPVHEKVNIGLDVRFSYGMRGSRILSVDGVPLTTDSSSFTYNTHYFECSVSPEIQMMLTSSMGLQASFNLFNLRRETRAYLGNENSLLNYSFSLNPSIWKFGIFMYFGRKE